MAKQTHPADTDGNFQITMTDLLDCASEWLAGSEAMEKPCLLRAAVILVDGQDGGYRDSGGDGPHKWSPT